MLSFHTEPPVENCDILDNMATKDELEILANNIYSFNAREGTKYEISGERERIERAFKRLTPGEQSLVSRWVTEMEDELAARRGKPSRLAYLEPPSEREPHPLVSMVARFFK